jgi:hypothetical protein
VTTPFLKDNSSVNLTAVGRYLPEFKATNLSIGVQKAWFFNNVLYLVNPQFVVGLYEGETTTSTGFILYQRVAVKKIGLNCFWQENWNSSGYLNGTLTFDLDYEVYNKSGVTATAGLSANFFNPTGLSDTVLGKAKSTVSFGPVVSIMKAF